MADNKDTDNRTPGEKARQVMNRVLKKKTVCGELIIQPESKEEFLSDHKDPQCAKDLAHKGPKDTLQTIHAAISIEADKAIRQRKGRNANLACTPPDIKQAGTLYYRATDEVLGFVEPKDWSSGQSLACDLITKTKRLAADAPPEIVPDHGLTCKPEGTRSISTVSSCTVKPKQR